MAYVPKGGPVPVHPWLLIFRLLQLFFAILIIATTAYPLSIDGGGPLQSPLISTIIAGILTTIPVLPLTTPLHISQRRLYDPRIALVLDILATLLWLASFAALASYLNVFSDYGRQLRLVDVVFARCGKCRSAWRSGVAAAVFSAIEFFLFLFTTLIFIYYYHCHLAGETAYGISGRRARANDTDNTYGVAHPISGPAVRTGATEEHQLRSNPSHSHTGLNGHSPTAATQSSAHGNTPSNHPRTVNQDDEIGSDMPASPKTYGSGPTNEPGSPVSVSQFPQPPKSNHPTTDSPGANLPEPGAPSSPPRSPTSPTRPGGPDEYGVEHGSNVGPGADTTRP